jgi:hypothetical protein
MKYLVILLSLITTAAAANDLMYPPAPAAQKAIQIDGQGFVINGRQTYVASGSIHYARVPHELWRDRLLRLKRAGFNTVETYAFWNFHEPRENQWDFSGDHDFAAFLDTAQKVGLYAIVRVGPYVCAEWDSGGYPVWLKFKPPMKVRTADPEYLKWNDHWYDKILPIVAAHQIHKGGNVIMVQLENEHPKGWGTVEGNPYFDHLRQKALALGIEVPHFFSGLNHGAGPWPGHPLAGRVAGRTTPWFSTEFWPGWFDMYGNLPNKRFKEVERDNWRILAHGGTGHNFYMLHGGSNFETWNDDSGAASYDYGAAIGQCGDLRPIYYRMKRATLFAKTLPQLRDLGAKIEFDENSAKSLVVKVGDEEFLACDARMLGGTAFAKLHTDVTYGPSGQKGSFRAEGKELALRFPSDEPQEQQVTLSTRETLRVISMSTALADRTWIITDKCVICGPAFVGDVREKDGIVSSLTIERPYGHPSCGKVIVYGDKVQQFAVHADMSLDTVPPPQLKNWQMRLSPEAATAFDDASWKASDDPQQMGADGDTSAFAWYRAVVNLKGAAQGTLDFSGYADDVRVFVNGELAGETAPFHAGRNVISVLTSHRGRNKAFNYLGALNDFHRKGLFGPVQLVMGNEKIDVKGWKMRGGAGPIDAAWPAVAAPNADDGEHLHNLLGTWGVDAGLPAFYRATFHDKPVPGRMLRLVTKSLSRGTAWLNGHNLGRYPEKIRCPGIYLPECWLKNGENTLVIFDETGASPGEVKLEIDRAASREVITVSEPCDASVPLVVPKDQPAVPKLTFATKDNVAWKNPATASSSERDNRPEMANDGDLDTRWCAAGGSTPQWWRVDLGKPFNLTGCEICWENDGTRYRYVVEGSADLKTWSVLSDQRRTQSTSQLQKLAFHAAGIRYFRITVTGLPRQPASWASICEVKVTAEQSK